MTIIYKRSDLTSISIIGSFICNYDSLGNIISLLDNEDQSVLKINENLFYDIDKNTKTFIRIGEIIEISPNKSYIIRSHKRSLEYYILLPTLSIDVKLNSPLKVGVDSILANVYSEYNDNSVQYKNKILLLIRNNQNLEFLKYHTAYKKSFLYEEMIPFDEFHDLYIFTLWSDFVDLFKQFKLGQYSKFDKENKKLIINWCTSDKSKLFWKNVFDKNIHFKKDLETKLNCKLNDDDEVLGISETGILKNNIKIPNYLKIDPSTESF